MKKNIQEFHKGELIRLFACGWQEVKSDPEPHHDRKYFSMWIQILGLRIPAVFAFEADEEFEYQLIETSEAT